jgi:hypothetical protein
MNFCRFTAFLLCIVLLLSSFFVLSFADEDLIIAPGGEVLPEEDGAKAEAFAALEKSQAYKVIYEGLAAGQDEISLEGMNCTVEEVQSVVQSAIYTCPELFYVENYSYSYYSDGESGQKIVVGLFPRYATYTDAEGAPRALEEVIAEYNAFMKELYDLGSMEWSDLETALFYHDYLTAYYEYDTDYGIYDAYGFLKNKEGVCQAYTLVFMGLMEHFGIPCTYAQSENINHIWNVVFIDGEWFHMDATWDDPLSDRPGLARHHYFLIGSETNQNKHFDVKGQENDMILGAQIPVSQDDHTYTSIWRDTETPFVEAAGSFYGIVIVDELEVDVWGKETVVQKAKFSEIHFEKGGQITGYDVLPMIWPTQEGVYGGNFSGMCTDGRYVYYSDEDTIYRYDPLDGQKTSVKEYDDGRVLWGLRFENGKLMACRGSTYGERVLEEALLRLPVYHTITWIIDGEEYVTMAEEGTVPDFDGSTWKENENGISYQFIGWTPELSEAYCDMTYVAIYKVIYEYIAGDISGDGTVDISDVTALLKYLSNPETASVNLSALDANGDDAVDISDVTVLLSYLAGNDVTLH